jgi:hypothetical protein
MPNRIIKESICTSETIDLLTAEEECFFYRLIVNCDDYGRMDARTPILVSRCFPLRSNEGKRKQVEKMIDSLLRSELIFLYAEGKYLQIIKWDKHQRIRAARSKYPEPSADEIIRCQLTADDNKCSRNPIQSESESELTPFEIAFEDFMEMRKKIKKPLTDKARQLILKRLNELSVNEETQIAILNQSTMNCWQGVFELKTVPQKQQLNSMTKEQAEKLSWDEQKKFFESGGVVVG